jgi:hypothetical protein
VRQARQEKEKDMRMVVAMLALGALMSAGPIHAQEKKAPATYKVEFDVVDGKDTWHYSMLVDESRKRVFQAANRVPVAGGAAASVDTGAKIECMVQELGDKAVVEGTIELTRITGYVNLSAITQPVIGQRKLTFHKTVELETPADLIDGGAGPRVAAKVTRAD